MTRAKISQYSATANDNTDVNGVNIAEGCPPSSMNNMGREIMAALKRFQVGSDGDGVTVGGSLVVSGSTSVNTFNVDVISEKTSAAGVTVDGVLLKDGLVGIGADGSASAPSIYRASDTNTGIFFPAADTIAFAEGGAEAMRINSSGNVGIGTTAPDSKLSIDHSSTSTSVLASYANIPLLLQNTSNTDNNWSVIAVQDASGDFSSYIGTQNTSQSSNTAIMAFATNGGSGATERMRIDSSGNVGIGTSSPAFTSGTGLEVQRAADATVRVERTDATASAGEFVASSGLVKIGSPGGVPFTFITDNAERARITAGGKFLFNTTTQNANEQVGMVYSSNAGVGFSIQDSNAQNGNTFIEFRNGATVAGTITSNGTTTMVYGSASDYRLKSNPQPIQNALATIAALNPVSFTWNQTGDEGVGFIAHEVQAVLPDCVVGQKDAEDENGNPVYQMIDTGSASLIATLTAAIQELKAELDTVKAELATLKG